MNEATFWEFKRKHQGRQEETSTDIMGKDGELKTDKASILNAYENFYKELFKIKEAKTKEEKINEDRVNKQFEEIRITAEEQEGMVIKKQQVEKAIWKLKNKKAADMTGWNNEMIKYGGDDMI